MTRTPHSTYRLQLHAGFTLHDAAALVPYLRDLGVDWVYLSPVLQAVRGSTHGYDVVDHDAVDAERGGADGLRALADAAHGAGLGVLVDIVPNHVGVADPGQNAAWADVLRHGRDAAGASMFDIDWDAAGGRLLLPVLGDDGIDAVTLDLDGDEPALAYHERRFPVAPGTASPGDDAADVHARQHYELGHWTRADAELTYRRFFGVNDLAGVRVEDPAVFERATASTAAMVRDGLADGVRVDHPDGLRDPGEYLDRLGEAVGGAPVWVEKILHRGEHLPVAWRTEGTTGYDALGWIDRVFVDPAGEPALDELDERLRGAPFDWHAAVRAAKREVADGMLGSEVRRLARDARADGFAGVDDAELIDGIAELLAAMPVYRTYLPEGSAALAEAVSAATASRPELAAAIAAIAELLRDPGSLAGARFQQTSGMVEAKGVEDRAFYRWTRLTSLTEVGGDPAEFAIPPEALAARLRARAAASPHALSALSTHDTKRSADVRARVSVLAEVPDVWASALGAIREAVGTADGTLDALVVQAAVGAWPAPTDWAGDRGEFRDRLRAYAEKAIREASTATTWTAPDAGFELAVRGLVDAIVGDPVVRGEVERLVDRVEGPGRSNALGAALLQLVAPGVPDVYQGSERWDLSLVDPDNRRPVDHAASAALLGELDRGAAARVDDEASAKLALVSRALRLRRDRPELFGSAEALRADGAAATHAIVLDAGGAIAVATRLPIGLAARGGWGDTTVTVDGDHVDVLTGRTVRGAVPLADLLDPLPVALLVPVAPDGGHADG